MGFRHTADPIASQIMGVPFGLTADGYELQWQVNYLAPFLFVSELLPLLLTTASTIQSKGRVRVVNLSSDMATLLGPKQILLEDVNMTDQKGMTVLLWVCPISITIGANHTAPQTTLLPLKTSLHTPRQRTEQSLQCSRLVETGCPF
jgi:NAD(P)-dependent dehydrogenase (short-subunit alcohol dehydrogenase family)